LSLRSRFVDEIPDEVVEAQRFTLMQPGGRVSSDYTAAPANGNSDPYSGIRVGSIVNHPRWGEGAVLKRSGSGEHTEFEVRFTYAGTKTLLAKFAKLQLVRR
jgi:DNA helicase-2/ATP-dependent DNA helicase PcrA